MAVIDSYIMAAGVTGDATGRKKGEDSHGYRVRWFAECDSQSDTAATVLEYFRRTSGRPYIGSTYSAGGDSDSQAVCTAISPSLIEKSGGMFHVDVTYEPIDNSGDDAKPTKGDAGKASTDPREWHDELDVSYTQISIPCEQATFQGFSPAGISNPFMKPGKLMVPMNSAGIPFDPQLEYEIDVKVVRITKYAAAFNGDGSNKWIGVVNKDAVTIDKPFYGFKDTWGPQTARIKGMPSTFGIINGIPHWRLGIEVHITPIGWRRLIADRGLHVRQAAGDREFSYEGDGSIISASDAGDGSPAVAALKDSEGYPISEPVLLDGNGQPLAKDKPPVWLHYQVYEERSYAGINW